MAQPFVNPNYFNPYMPHVQPPMDRLAQLQAQQYQVGTQMSLPQQQPQSNQGILYVQGEAGAKSWMVAANSTVLLMDSENPVFYLKSADASGVPLPLRTFDYVERTNAPQSMPQDAQSVQENLDDKYVTRQEYDALQGKYMEILERLNNFPTVVSNADDTKRTAAGTSKPRGKGGNANE